MKHFLYILYIAFSAALPARTLAEGGEGVPPCVKIAGEPTAAIYNRYNKEIRSRRYLSEGCPVICGSVAEDWRNCAAWSLFPANPMRKQSVSSSTTTASSKAAKPT